MATLRKYPRNVVVHIVDFGTHWAVW
jgi:hypothetical protein